MRQLCFLLVLFGMCLLPLGLAAQSNDFIDSVIDSPALSAEQAAYLILVASDNLGDDSDAARAWELLEQLGWVPPGVKADSRLVYSEFCHMLMKAFGIKGGIMYQLFPGPRYAYRDLRHLVVVQGSTDPMMPVSGTGAMKMIGRIFDVKGVEK